MVANPDLVYLLDQTAKVFRPAESVSAMVTAQNLSLQVASEPCHIQAMSPVERILGMGVEQDGDYWGFFHSTADVAVGDMVQGLSGPWAGTNFWLRTFATDTDVSGIEHRMAVLDVTPQTTGTT